MTHIMCSHLIIILHDRIGGHASSDDAFRATKVTSCDHTVQLFTRYKTPTHGPEALAHSEQNSCNESFTT